MTTVGATATSESGRATAVRCSEPRRRPADPTTTRASRTAWTGSGNAMLRAFSVSVVLASLRSVPPRVVQAACFDSPRCRSGLALAPASQAIMYTPPQELPDKEMLEGP